MKQKAIIIDLDGTLCNSQHRQHFMEKTPKDWDNFYDHMSLDEPHDWCVAIIQRFVATHEIIFVSGRPDNYGGRTIQWLEKHVVGMKGLHLHMRKMGDYRRDSIVKTEIYREHIEPHFDVLFCIDDRQQVVDAWRELGLTCLQCAKGDF